MKNGEFSGIFTPAINRAIDPTDIAPTIFIILRLNRERNFGPNPAANDTKIVAIIIENKILI